MSLTPEERAEKMAREYANSGAFEWTEADEAAIAKDIAAQIRDAVEEDRITRTADDLYKLSYARGKAEAYEDAAREVNSFMYEKGLSVELIDLAEKIRARAIEVSK